MKNLLCDLLNFYEDLEKVKVINGNYYSLNVLDEFPEYVQKRENLVARMVSEPQKRGRPRSVSAETFLVELINQLYKDSGEEYGSLRSLKTCLSACFFVGYDDDHSPHMSMFFKTAIREEHDATTDDGEVIATHRQNRIHWIDTFSALDKYCNIFGGEDANFEEFLESYEDCYGKMNNLKLQPFYARSIVDISAAYTIFTHQTTEYFQKLRSKLKQAVVDGRALENLPRAIGDTDQIREHIVKRIVSVLGRDTAAVERELIDYIKEHPYQFDIERHYSAIRGMLNNMLYPVNEDDVVVFEVSDTERELIRLFSNFDSSPEEKDLKIKAFEKVVLNQFTQHFEAGGENHHVIQELVRKNIATGDYGPKEAAENVLEMLRCLTMLYRIQKVDSSSRTTKKELLREIEVRLANYGVMPLLRAPKDMYTRTRELDWCLYRCVEKRCNH